MKAKDLIALSLPRDTPRLLALEPEQFDFAAIKGSDLKETLRSLRDVWLDLLVIDAHWTTEDEQDEETFIILAEKLLTTYALAQEALTTHELLRGKPPFPGFGLPDAVRLLNEAPPTNDLGPVNMLRVKLKLFTVSYIFLLIGATMAALPGGFTEFRAMSTVHELSLDAAADLAASIGRGAVPHAWSNSLVAPLLRRYSDGFEVQAALHHAEHTPGVFSQLVLHELPLLAQRQPAVQRRYGEKRIEKRFEHQLGLLMSSLGFYVVATDTGTRTVDLVCTGGAGVEPVTFLLEAKTTKRPYALPPSDERAMREYAEDVKAVLTTLPKLRFVLMVAHAEAKTLSRKLESFEHQLGVPVRFVRASTLATLRERIVGPVDAGDFSSAVLGSNPIISDEIVELLSDNVKERESVHVDMVKRLFAARRQIRGR